MRIYISFFLTLIMCSAFGQKNSDYTDLISAYQKNIADEFTNDPTSPLDSAEKVDFKGYTFLSIDTNYAVNAKFKLTPKSKAVEMPTSGTRVRTLRQYGVAIFKMHGKKCKLSLFESVNANTTTQDVTSTLFLPFKDLTNGITTYGGGRFIDVAVPKGKHIIIDFNKAYNPYCAWSHRYSCTLPPEKNYLNIDIPVGASYEGDH